ncbi:MAG TPA: pilin [Candidatus Saccharimonadia bacterium]|nr:pilin [Candidatus Saccharimonadia bacterium]
MNLLKRGKLFMAVCGVAFFGLGSMMPALVSADPPVTIPQPQTAQQAVCQTLDPADTTNTCKDKNPKGSLSIDSIIKTIVNIFSFVIGVVAVIMIMVSGYRYISSGGDSSKVASARSTITYAIIGLVVTALAQGIVRFVLTKL